MITPRVACAVRRWVSLYTRGLPPAIGERRRDEVADDLWSQVAEAQETGRGDGATALEIAVRLLAGLPADIAWRLEKRGLRKAHEGSTTLGSPLAGALGLVGGLLFSAALLVIFLLIPSMGPDRPWSDPVIGPFLVFATSVGLLAMGCTTLTLVIRNQDRLRRIAVAAGAFGFLAAFLGALGPFHLVVFLAAGSAVLVHGLWSIGVLDGRLACAHVVAAIAFVIVVGALMAGAAVGGLGVVILAYPISWILLGFALMRGPSPAEAPAEV